MKFPLSDLLLGREEEEALKRVLQSRWLSMGPETEAFESEFREFTGATSALAVSNCTAALHLALLACGVGPGDEVILPALTFVATPNSVLYTGAKPVFADITSITAPSIDPAEIERKITPKTKAVIVMHYAGYPCDMDRILELCRKHRLRLIEDAAHCAGSRHRDQVCGTLGDFGCFSLFGNKNLPAGEGGVLVGRDPSLLADAKVRRSHGMTHLSWDRSRGHAQGYDVVELGYNYRMPELSAAIARAQLAKVTDHNRRRDDIFENYLENLNGHPELEIPFANTRGTTPGSRHLMTVLLPEGADRQEFMASLSRSGVQSSVHYPPAYSFSYYRARPAFKSLQLPKTEEFSRRVVTLPFHPGLSSSDVKTIAAAVLTALGTREN